MIDEKRLIKDIQNRINYWENKAAEYEIVGDTEGIDICVEKTIELGAVMRFIKDMPKVGEWIPFTVDDEGILDCKMPDEGEEILVSDGADVMTDIFMNNGEECYLDGWNRDLIGLAWQPCPEPWKGEEK